MIFEMIPTRSACKNGTELDAIAHARDLKWRAGERGEIKRGMRRRHRRGVRQMLRTAY